MLFSIPWQVWPVKTQAHTQIWNMGFLKQLVHWETTDTLTPRNIFSVWNTLSSLNHLSPLRFFFFSVQDVKSLDVSFLSRYMDKMTNYAWLSLGWKVYMFFVNWQAVWISVWGVFHIWCLNNVNRMTAYAERCRTVISEKGSALGPGTRLDHSRASV